MLAASTVRTSEHWLTSMGFATALAKLVMLPHLSYGLQLGCGGPTGVLICIYIYIHVCMFGYSGVDQGIYWNLRDADSGCEKRCLPQRHQEIAVASNQMHRCTNNCEHHPLHLALAVFQENIEKSHGLPYYTPLGSP